MAFRTNKPIITGYIVCPAWLHKVYRISCGYTCMLCNKHEDKIGKLQPHRLKEKNQGGLYTVCRFSDKQNNIKMLCSKCHKFMHANQYSHISHSY